MRRIRIGHTRLTHGHLMSRNNQQPTSGNVAYGNQRLKIKHCQKDCPIAMEGQQKEHNIQGDISALLGKDCEVEKIMRFLKEIGMFEKI